MAATGAAHAIPRLLRAVGSIAAPTSVITALLFYFGRLHASAFLFYFGVNFTALDLTVQDYLVRSADGLFRPAAATAALVLLAFWAHRVTTQVLGEPARRRVRRVVVPVAGSAGAVLLGIAFLGMIRGDRIYRPVPEIGGLTLAGGVLLLSYAARSVRRPDAGPVRRRPPDGAPVGTGVTLAEWGVTFALVSIGLFWTVGTYAIGVGTGRAKEMEARLPAWPTATVFAERSLSLRQPGVLETRCSDPEAAYRFRYDGLKLILRSGEQYLFLPAHWSTSRGDALLIPRSNAVRVEFTRDVVARPAC